MPKLKTYFSPQRRRKRKEKQGKKEVRSKRGI
jgi:hypothetical protein